MLIRRKLIRLRTIELLKRYGINEPPVPVEKIAAGLGATIVRHPADDALSGFLLRDKKNARVIIGVNKVHHANRQRFTIAHELGHFLLHEGEELHIDKAKSGYEVKLRDARSSSGTNVDEMEANLFAAEMLLPKRFLDDDLLKREALSLTDDDEIKELASRYEVSVQALTLRLNYLNYVVQ